MKYQLKLKAYTVVANAVENAIPCGLRKAHKHADEPSDDHITSCIYEEVMAALDEIIDWGDQDDCCY